MSYNSAEIAGARFYYELAGAGRPLVFVHAGIADSRMWDDQFPAFARYYRVLRYDRRGFGQTAMAAGTFSHYNDLYELLKFLDIAHAYLVGCSQGAKTVIDFAIEHHEMADALVLAAPALGGFTFTGEHPRQAWELEQAEEAGDIERINELELQIWVDGAQRTPDQVDPKVREKVREMNRIALSAPGDLGTELALDPPAADRLDEIQAPTLVIGGELDTPRSLAVADYLVEHIPGSWLVSVTGAAHLLNMEKPAEFNHQVLSFLSSLI